MPQPFRHYSPSDAGSLHGFLDVLILEFVSVVSTLITWVGEVKVVLQDASRSCRVGGP